MTLWEARRISVSDSDAPPRTATGKPIVPSSPDHQGHPPVEDDEWIRAPRRERFYRLICEGRDPVTSERRRWHPAGTD